MTPPGARTLKKEKSYGTTGGNTTRRLDTRTFITKTGKEDERKAVSTAQEDQATSWGKKRKGESIYLGHPLHTARSYNFDKEKSEEAPIGPCEAYRSSKKENVKPKKDGGPFFVAWADNIWNDTYTESSWHLKK